MSKADRANDAAAAGTLLPVVPDFDAPAPAIGPAFGSRLDQIRAAGLELLFRHGYSGMTMREIAATLNIKAASLYYHFPSKQHILFDLMHATVSELLQGLRDIVASVREPVAQLEAAIRWHVLFHTHKRKEAFVSHSELRFLEPDNLHEILKLRREYERLFDAILKRGHRKGVFQVEEFSVIRNCILTMCTATAGWFSPRGPLSAEELAEQIGRFVQSALVKGGPITPLEVHNLPEIGPDAVR
ncbi:MAG: TetR/AcrR family transcriptional regulator [Acidobacteria bacterium]|nr:TetR/AcrR family transcriptional regulator [Acidobacteriota bacterium]